MYNHVLDINNCLFENSHTKLYRCKCASSICISFVHVHMPKSEFVKCPAAGHMINSLMLH